MGPPLFEHLSYFAGGVFENAFLSIKNGSNNVPISPPNFTIHASKVPFHANFMLLNDLQNERQFPTNFLNRRHPLSENVLFSVGKIPFRELRSHRLIILV